MELKHKIASVVQWYDESLPSSRPGFDSPLMHLNFDVLMFFFSLPITPRL